MLIHVPGRKRSVTPLSIAVLSLSMSADAFAASIGRGASQRPSVSVALKGGLVFGVVEAITPLVGWALGLAAASYVAAVDHWIAFVLLSLVGGKMVWEGFQPESGDAEQRARRASPWTLVATAVGTSIDAAAVGVSLAFLGSDIVTIALSIGFATFVMTTIGMLIGRAVGHRLGKTVEVLGGLALIALGSSILADHLGLFA
ncbi:manganese efflux pump [Azospirillum sp. YIM B02556]|uniref:Putative manganese efflux pump MntP n=1 Tax=Azospirillum endophyticum TaxID=2800326 RepID=A0ABS1FES8_9PROT|nr:manganese efflux pump [Azospirillum endophyticum]